MTDEYDADHHEGTHLLDGPDEAEPVHQPGRRRRERSRVPGCLAALAALAVIVGLLYVGVTWGLDRLSDQFSGAEDYPGPGSGEVTFQVTAGDTVAQMGRNLKDEGVVASVEAFIDAASANPDAKGIQAGYYPLLQEMKASDVVEVLVDPTNQVKATVTIPEGLRVVDTVQILAKKTDFSKKDFEKVLADPSKLGLPDYAGGNPEGYLFPATYDFGPDATPESMLRAMVDRWRQAASDADLEAKAAALGYTPQQVMTIASLVQAEGRGDDMPKIARVIYNRLEIEPNPSAGFLQVDASVNYALGRPTIAVLSQDQIDSVADSPYNTYKQKGLPPTPIEAPGDAAIDAATHPAEGPWFFYVTTNLKTGETKFTDSYDEFLTFKQELRDYCATQSDRC